MGEARDRKFTSVQDIEAAFERRLVIGQAQGILMERLGLSAERAFAFLSRISQQTNTKLCDVAAELVETRRIPSLVEADLKNV